jgi:hypothetical protein
MKKHYHSNMLYSFAILVLFANSLSSALAQNNFFGNSLPNGPGGLSGGPVDERDRLGVQGSTPGGGPGPADFTEDEKRMRRKYKANMAHCRDLISKGEKMMKDGEGKDDKAYKKGKILKDIGEKQLADLQANSPFPDDAKREQDKKKKEAAKADSKADAKSDAKDTGSSN